MTIRHPDQDQEQGLEGYHARICEWLSRLEDPPPSPNTDPISGRKLRVNENDDLRRSSIGRKLPANGLNLHCDKRHDIHATHRPHFVAGPEREVQRSAHASRKRGCPSSPSTSSLECAFEHTTNEDLTKGCDKRNAGAQTLGHPLDVEAHKPSNLYQKRPRHKTRPEIYEPHLPEVKTPDAGQNRGRRALRTQSKLLRKPISHTFSSGKVTEERLTSRLDHHRGIFNRAKHSASTDKVPDLASSGLTFARKTHHPVDRQHHLETTAWRTHKAAATTSQAEVSRFFRSSNREIQATSVAEDCHERHADQCRDCAGKITQPTSLNLDLEDNTSPALLATRDPRRLPREFESTPEREETSTFALGSQKIGRPMKTPQSPRSATPFTWSASNNSIDAQRARAALVGPKTDYGRPLSADQNPLHGFKKADNNSPNQSFLPVMQLPDQGTGSCQNFILSPQNDSTRTAFVEGFQEPQLSSRPLTGSFVSSCRSRCQPTSKVVANPDELSVPEPLHGALDCNAFSRPGCDKSRGGERDPGNAYGAVAQRNVRGLGATSHSNKVLHGSQPDSRQYQTNSTNYHTNLSLKSFDGLPSGHRNATKYKDRLQLNCSSVNFPSNTFNKQKFSSNADILHSVESAGLPQSLDQAGRFKSSSYLSRAILHAPEIYLAQLPTEGVSTNDYAIYSTEKHGGTWDPGTSSVITPPDYEDALGDNSTGDADFPPLYFEDTTSQIMTKGENPAKLDISESTNGRGICYAPPSPRLLKDTTVLSPWVNESGIFIEDHDQLSLVRTDLADNYDGLLDHGQLQSHSRNIGTAHDRVSPIEFHPDPLGSFWRSHRLY